jgi:phage-related protein
MALTPQAGFSTLTLLPSWDISYSVEFKNKERSLGNNYLQISDGGNANPQEVVSLIRAASANAVDSAVSDLRSYQGSTAFNWRLFPGGNYKLYFCTSFSEEMLSGAWERISAQLTRHPNPIYDPQPDPVADGRPWGLLTQPIKWGNQQNNEANPLVLAYNPGEVEARRAQSLFAAQNTIRDWTVEFPSISSVRLAEIELFLRQRRGRIPFQLNVGYGTPSTLWICSKWSVRLMGQRTTTAADMRYSMSLGLRQVYRPVGAN